MIKKINQITVRLGGVLMFLSYTPQIYKILTTKNVQGISLAFILMVALAVCAFALDGYIIYKETGDSSTMIAQILNLIPAIITIVLILIYQ